ncbi:MAG: hypothetical protein IPP19_12060 [Verrucomicrobia bacterium]|nr:hypothetical protein [Verrucomicrobiota bacterium]
MSPIFGAINGAGCLASSGWPASRRFPSSLRPSIRRGKTCGVSVRYGDGAWIGCRHAVKVTLDLDSTRLLHEDGHQEGIKVGYTRTGLKPCLHPLLAVVAEARLVAQLWLRAAAVAPITSYRFSRSVGPHAPADPVAGGPR